MNPVVVVLAIIFLCLWILALVKGSRLKKLARDREEAVATSKRELNEVVADRDAQIAAVNEKSERVRQHYESEALRIHGEAQAAVDNAQKQADQQVAELKKDGERIRLHHESEVLRIHNEAQAAVDNAKKQAEEQIAELKKDGERIRLHHESAVLRIHNETQVAIGNAQKQAEEQIAELKKDGERLRLQFESESLRILGEAQTAVDNAQRQADQQIAETKKDGERLRFQYESESLRIHDTAQAAVSKSQQLFDQEIAKLKEESERVRQHYEAEARKIQESSDAALANLFKEMEPLRKYESLRDAETEIRAVIAGAINEATALRKDAFALLEEARTVGSIERLEITQRAREIREQADALLNQATRDTGRIIAEAEKRAEQIGGDAYRALREKELLEHAAEAMRNIVEGYGDRYLMPAHSLLDDLAAEFGYAAAGESLKSARELSRRMVDQGEAATCGYAEPNRRKIAINFVIFAFNGLVDSILSEIREFDPGTLEQKIRDAFSLVNKDGQAFRDARVLPTYLDARLAELKWGVVVQELARRRQEEQRYARQQARDEEKAKQESERAIQEAKKEEEMLRVAEEDVRHENERALAELSARLEKASEAQRVELQKAIEEQKAKFEVQLKQKDEEIRLAAERSALAISNARKTKRGHVYIISNIGSFDSDVFKIGLTRRDDWQERIDELGDASVPFEFDVHGIIQSDNAPELERKLHTRFMALRVNKLNTRREFFRVSLKEIMEEVGKLKKGEDYIGDINWTEAARATQWKETRDIESSPEKLEKWLESARARSRRLPDINASSFDEL